MSTPDELMTADEWAREIAYLVALGYAEEADRRNTMLAKRIMVASERRGMLRAADMVEHQRIYSDFALQNAELMAIKIRVAAGRIGKESAS